MTRPTAIVVALAAGGVGTLLWCAWLILSADLTLDTGIAAWGLWLLVAAAATTLVAYVRELGRHHHSVTKGGSWKPLPSLVLLWVAGATAVGVFLFMMPSSAATGNADQATNPQKAQVDAGAAPLAGTPTTTSRTSATTASRSKARTATPTSSPTSPTATGVVASTSQAPRPRTTTRPTTSTSSSPTSTTTTPLVTITLPQGQPKPTKPPHTP